MKNDLARLNNSQIFALIMAVFLVLAFGYAKAEDEAKATGDSAKGGDSTTREAQKPVGKGDPNCNTTDGFNCGFSSNPSEATTTARFCLKGSRTQVCTGSLEAGQSSTTRNDNNVETAAGTSQETGTTSTNAEKQSSPKNP